MKKIGALLLLGGIILGGWSIKQMIQANQQYTNSIGNYWTLADRSSTIEKKSQYLDKFVAGLENSGLQGTNDALWYFTPENSFDSNFEAVKSLQSRLHSISTMDENSFAYQSAIQQITEQEQGQAQDMLMVFHGSWDKVHYYYLWNPFIGLGLFLAIVSLIVSGFTMLISNDYDRY